MNIREWFADLFGIVAVSWMLYHFSLIVKYGTFLITEGNPYILWAEIIALVGILALMIERLINDIKGHLSLPLVQKEDIMAKHPPFHKKKKKGK